MFGLSTLIIAVTILYILSRIFIQKLFTVLYRITRDDKKATVFLGLIFLPGTFIHEISHFITALFLLVPVGELNLMPEVMDGGVKLGSVEIGKTDFIRGSLIGLAPIISGASIIFWTISFALNHNYLTNPWVLITLIYIIFQIIHTMFSSKQDLRAVLELVVFIAVVVVALILLKIYEPFNYLYQQIQITDPLFLKLSYLLFIPICVELVFLAFFKKQTR